MRRLTAAAATFFLLFTGRDPTRPEDDPMLVRAARARLDAEGPGWEEEERGLRAAWSASD